MDRRVRAQKRAISTKCDCGNAPIERAGVRGK
nr:MAG TPA: hypothetical protein [Caudoviricetes sp.]